MPVEKLHVRALSPEIEEVFQSLIDARHNDVVEGELDNARLVIGRLLRAAEADKCPTPFSCAYRNVRSGE